MARFKHVWHDRRTLRNVHLTIGYEIVNDQAGYVNIYTDAVFWYASDAAMTRAIAELTDGESYMDLHAASLHREKVLYGDVEAEVTQQFRESITGAALRDLCVRNWRDSKHDEAGS